MNGSRCGGISKTDESASGTARQSYLSGIFSVFDGVLHKSQPGISRLESGMRDNAIRWARLPTTS